MADLKAVFEALPHVNEVWITEDGHFHLYEVVGGQKVMRDAVTDNLPATEGMTESEISELNIPDNPGAFEQAMIENETVEQPEQPKKRGRKANAQSEK